MGQDRNPQFVPLLAEVGPNKIGSDLIQVQNTAGGESVVWRLNQFMTSIYDGFGVPGNNPGDLNYQAGVLPNHLYTDLSTGFLWYWNGTVWVQLTSGGGGGSCSPDDSIPGQILTVDVADGGISGYANGDTSTVAFGNFLAVVTITNAVDGVVQPGGVSITNPGGYYTVGQNPTIVLTGAGDGTLLLDVNSVTSGTVGDFLINGGGDCAGSDFYYINDGVSLPSLNSQDTEFTNGSSMSLSAAQIQFITAGEIALTSTLTSEELDFSINSFDNTTGVNFGTYGASGLSLQISGLSTEVELNLNGLGFIDFANNPAGNFNPSVNGNVSTSIDFYGATSGTVKLTANPIAGSTMPICLPDSDPAESGDVLVTDAGTGGDCWFGTGQQLSWASVGGGGEIEISAGDIAGGTGPNAIGAIPGASFDDSGNIILGGITDSTVSLTLTDVANNYQAQLVPDGILFTHTDSGSLFVMSPETIYSQNPDMTSGIISIQSDGAVNLTLQSPANPNVLGGVFLVDVGVNENAYVFGLAAPTDGTNPGGFVSTYSDYPTMGNGMAVIRGKDAQVNVTGSVSLTELIETGAFNSGGFPWNDTLPGHSYYGMFRVNVYVVCRSVSVAGTLDGAVTYTDNSGAQSVALFPTMTCSAPGILTSNSFFIYAVTPSTINYSLTASASTFNYDMFIQVESM